MALPNLKNPTYIYGKTGRYAVTATLATALAAPGTGTVTLTLPPTAYSLEELPLHRDVIQGFHATTHVNSYHEGQQ